MIRVLIVDDSALVRSILKTILESAPGIEVVGVAADPYFARDKIKKLDPDVITLDVEMPRMDGLTFLEKLMNYKPKPVIMVSTLTRKGAETTMKALSLGAVDFVAKPTTNLEQSLTALGVEIVEKVRAAAGANVKVPPKRPTPVAMDRLEVNQKLSIDQVLAARALKMQGTDPVICIGASTGGTVAIESLLCSLPATLPGIVIVQHMPFGFTEAFANRINGLCPFEVVEARTGMKVQFGRVIIAQGGKHLLLKKEGQGYSVEVKDGPPVNRHKPSVDVLFRSAANVAGKHALGVILTGMGDDGAKGLKDLHDAGAYTVAQDEKSCVVFGMPKVAIELGGASKVAPLEMIPSIIVPRLCA